MTNKDFGEFIKALVFAAHKHKDQRRKDPEASPYINHPIALVDKLVNEGGVTDIKVVIAALLHDTIEDTETTGDELEREFGSNIRSIVEEVTDDKKLPKEVRKQLQIDHAKTLSKEAKQVKLADKICNLEDVANCPPPDWSTDRRQDYFDWAKRVIDGLRGDHQVLEQLFDAAYKHRP